MAKSQLRKIEVNGKSYIWVLRPNPTWDVNAKWNIYSAAYKAGHLAVYFPIKDRTKTFPLNQQIVYKWTGEEGLSVFEPVTAVRVIRYAVNQLGWNPEQDKKRILVRNGYQLLNELGYVSEQSYKDET